MSLLVVNLKKLDRVADRSSFFMHSSGKRKSIMNASFFSYILQKNLNRFHISVLYRQAVIAFALYCTTVDCCRLSTVVDCSTSIEKKLLSYK